MCLNAKSTISIVLSVVLLRPPVPAEAAASSAALGSISSYGAVAVGTVAAPPASTLFAGDVVSTSTGNAVIQYKEGARVLLGTDSTAEFTPSGVQLQKGEMTFRSGSDKGFVFSAAALKLEPVSSNSVASVALKDGRASVTVTEGTMRAVDPNGARVASIEAGQVALFAMASPAAAPAAAPAPAAAAAAPQAGGGSNAILLLSLGIAAVGTTIGIAGFVRANDAQDRLEELEECLAASPLRPCRR